MTNAERMAFLSEHPVNSRWDLRDGRHLWTVTTFFATGHGWSFTEALDDAIRVCREREAAALVREQERIVSDRWFRRRKAMTR